MVLTGGRRYDQCGGKGSPKFGCPPKKFLKASRERKWESEAKVDYGGLDSHAKEFEHYYVHTQWQRF